MRRLRVVLLGLLHWRAKVLLVEDVTHGGFLRALYEPDPLLALSTRLLGLFLCYGNFGCRSWLSPQRLGLHRRNLSNLVAVPWAIVGAVVQVLDISRAVAVLG